MKRRLNKQSVLSLYRTKIIALISCMLSLPLSVSSALALNGKVGVVKSPENQTKWAEIINRFQKSGIDYCVLEQSNWQQASDLANLQVLFLPNVGNIHPNQATALEQWMNQGGKVIVTGPTGSLSQNEVKSQLRSLFGAYWGFSNPSAANLELAKDLSGEKKSLSSKLMGGAVIPTGINSKTAAFWNTRGNPPAVVFNEKATFIGWLWGENQISPTDLDIAWLQKTLNRYGFTGSHNSSINTAPSPCNTKAIAQKYNTQILENPIQPAAIETKPIDDLLGGNLTEKTAPIAYSNDYYSGISPSQVQQMVQELESLIARFESTLIAAEAKNINIDLSTHKIIEESLKHRGNGQGYGNQTSASQRSYQALIEARNGLERFCQLIQNQDYEQARQLWLKARRNLWDNYPTDRQFAQPEIRAMWLDRGTIVQAKSEAELAQIFDRMAEAGVNLVFFETVNSSYPIYPSRIAPEQNPLTRGWDPLKAAVKLAHERGMELHAWVWVFAATNQRHNEILGFPKDYLGPVLSRNPEWAMLNRQGGYFDYSEGAKKAFFDPANPEVQRYLLALMEEIVMNYDVDGIQFDYIRYPFQAPNKNQIYGYSNSSRWLFKEMTGVDPIEVNPGSALWNRWTGFKIRQVDNFVATTATRLKQRRPGLIVSAAVFPMERQERLFRLQQNWEEWGKNDWVDLIFLMTYAMDTGSFEDRIKPLNEPSSVGASLLIPGLRLLKVPDPVTIDQMQLVRNFPTTGFALFATENLTPNLQGMLNRIQGAVTTKKGEPLPHRKPFQAAASRYQALQKEWSFLLVNNQLAMDEQTMKKWGKEVDELANTLNELGKNPSGQNYSSAKAAMIRFRRQFPNWMRQHQKLRPYQVIVWQNRLEALEQLLNYGERLVFKQANPIR